MCIFIGISILGTSCYRKFSDIYFCISVTGDFSNLGFFIQGIEVSIRCRDFSKFRDFFMLEFLKILKFFENLEIFQNIRMFANIEIFESLAILENLEIFENLGILKRLGIFVIHREKSITDLEVYNKF